MSTYVKPPCCDKAKQFIRAAYEDPGRDDGDVDAYMMYVTRTPPVWRISARQNGDSGYNRFAQVSFCPFCGVRLPELRLRKTVLQTICVVVDGGYYCQTCEKRLIGCRCADPARLWEPAK